VEVTLGKGFELLAQKSKVNNIQRSASNCAITGPLGSTGAQRPHMSSSLRV
jgi:hypothetical protein